MDRNKRRLWDIQYLFVLLLDAFEHSLGADARNPRSHPLQRVATDCPGPRRSGIFLAAPATSRPAMQRDQHAVRASAAGGLGQGDQIACHSDAAVDRAGRRNRHAGPATP